MEPFPQALMIIVLTFTVFFVSFFIYLFAMVAKRETVCCEESSSLCLRCGDGRVVKCGSVRIRAMEDAENEGCED